MLTDQAAVDWLAPIAAWGYVVVASQYRGAGGSEAALDASVSFFVFSRDGCYELLAV